MNRLYLGFIYLGLLLLEVNNSCKSLDIFLNVSKVHLWWGSGRHCEDNGVFSRYCTIKDDYQQCKFCFFIPDTCIMDKIWKYLCIFVWYKFTFNAFKLEATKIRNNNNNHNKFIKHISSCKITLYPREQLGRGVLMWRWAQCADKMLIFLVYLMIYRTSANTNSYRFAGEKQK